MFLELTKWSHDNYSYLPWRIDRSLYNTLVSEIMLQQTTVGTVLNHFESFIQKYPDVRSLAAIDEEQVLKDWKGLGYYRRAKNLLAAAKQITKDHQGKIPVDYEKLVQIKGIGAYTANALIAIGENKPALALDANLERVIARLYGLRIMKGVKLHKAIQKLFLENEICQEIYQVGSRDYIEGLMDLGRSICKANVTACEICPLSEMCIARINMSQLDLPLRPEKEKNGYFELDLVRVIVQKNQKILVYKKCESEWLAGQYELPTLILKSEDLNLSQYPVIKNDKLFLLSNFRTSITKYKINNFVLHANEDELKTITNKKYEWKERQDLNLSTASLKALKHL